MICHSLGVEFEFASLVTSEQLAYTYANSGLKVTSSIGYGSSTPPGYDALIEYDRAFRQPPKDCPAHRNMLEAKTRVLSEDEWKPIVRVLLDGIVRSGAKLDTRAVFHLTLGLPGAAYEPRIIRNLMEIVYQYEEVIYALVEPISAMYNMSSVPILGRAMTALRLADDQSIPGAVASWGRVRGLNITNACDSTNPRIEIRYHHGTLDYERITAWKSMWCGILDVAYSDIEVTVKRPRIPNLSALDDLLEIAGVSNHEAILFRQDYRPNEKYRLSGNVIAERFLRGNGIRLPVTEQTGV